MREILQRFALVLLGSVLGLSLAELGLRATGQYRLEDYFLPAPPAYRGVREGVRHRSHPILGYENIPSAPGVNSIGLVDREYPSAKAPGVFRIALLGDSVMDDRDNFMEQIERRLSREPRLGFSVEVWNFAVGGYSVSQYPRLLEEKVLKYDPDMLVVSFCLNDVRDLRIPVYYKTERGFAEVYLPGEASRGWRTHWLFFHSRLFRLLVTGREMFLGKPELFAAEGHVREKLKALRRLAARKGLPLYCIIFPYLKPLAEYTQEERADYALLRSLLEELRMDWTDLHRLLDGADLESLRKWPQDPIHPSAAGHRLAAERMYLFILERVLRHADPARN